MVHKWSHNFNYKNKRLAKSFSYLLFYMKLDMISIIISDITTFQYRPIHFNVELDVLYNILLHLLLCDSTLPFDNAICNSEFLKNRKVLKIAKVVLLFLYFILKI